MYFQMQNTLKKQSYYNFKHYFLSISDHSLQRTQVHRQRNAILVHQIFHQKLYKKNIVCTFNFNLILSCSMYYFLHSGSFMSLLMIRMNILYR